MRVEYSAGVSFDEAVENARLQADKAQEVVTFTLRGVDVIVRPSVGALVEEPSLEHEIVGSRG
jgi:hypothetical protein